MLRRLPRTFSFIALGLAVFVFLDPFGILRPRHRVFRGSFPPERLEQLAQELEQRGRRPEEYLLTMLERHAVVLLGEFGRIREQVEFLRSALPQLHAAGHSVLGLSHLRAVDQPDIDRLLSADAFDRTLAEELLFRRKVLWGYTEYLELLRTAWELNAGRGPGQPAFVLLGLGARTEYSHVRSAADMEDAAVLRRVFPDGLPDEVMADAIMAYTAQADGSMLVYTGIESSFSRFVDRQYAAAVSLQGIGRPARAGVLVYRELGDAVATVLLHSPWPDAGERGGLGYPLEGLLDAVFELRPQPVAWSLAGSAFADIPVEHGLYVEGAERLNFGDMACGYILLAPLSGYSTVASIPGFITAENLERAVSGFPGPTPPRASATGLNDYMRTLSEDLQKRLREFR